MLGYILKVLQKKLLTVFSKDKYFVERLQGLGSLLPSNIAILKLLSIASQLSITVIKHPKGYQSNEKVRIPQGMHC